MRFKVTDIIHSIKSGKLVLCGNKNVSTDFKGECLECFFDDHV